MARFFYGNTAGPTEDMPDRKSQEKDWRPLFSPAALAWGESVEAQKSITRFTSYDWRCEATVRDGATRRVIISHPPVFLEDDWEGASFECFCTEARAGKYCRHMAAAMVRWEKEHGPWTAWESPREYQSRKEEERRAAERERREKLKKVLGMHVISAEEFFKDKKPLEGLLYVDIENAVRGLKTTPYYAERAKDVLKRFNPGYNFFQLKEGRDGRVWLEIRCTVSDITGHTYIKGKISGASIEGWKVRHDTSTYPRSLYGEGQEELPDIDPEKPLDEYELTALAGAWDYLERNKEVNSPSTDSKAFEFFEAMNMAAEDAVIETASSQQQVRAKREILTLEPRIIMDQGTAQLSFKIGKAGGKSYICRNLRGLTNCYAGEEVFEATKKEHFDFSELDFLEQDQPLMQFIAKRVGETRDFNERLVSRNYGRVSGTLSVGSSLELNGSLLDSFYEIAEGRRCEFQDKTNGIQGEMIPVGHRNLRFSLKLEDITDARESFAGIAISGLIPVMIHGHLGSYILNRDGLCRISDRELKVLKPFRRVADMSGYFRFRIGRENLQEFYYRILPALLENPCIMLDDRTSGKAQELLPPEPEFTFYLDYEDSWIFAHTRVKYLDQEFIISQDMEDYYSAEDGPVSEAGGYMSSAENSGGKIQVSRDFIQENRVLAVLQDMFSYWDSGSKQFAVKLDDDGLYDFLTAGTAKLGRYGSLRGTDAFRRLSVRPVPAVQVGVSIDSGLMDLSVTSSDLSPNELLDIMDSYRKKKRYHRIAGGTFVDLSDSSQLSEVDALLKGLDLTDKDVLNTHARLPLFRALYLDRLLEDHDALSATRDRTYRALIRNFKTVREAEYELPPSLENTLRSYQSYGFKWLKTLQGAGFGGILADEMGLGKTLQMISVFLSDHEEAVNIKPSLVVCPASLVYNCEEEIHRFAPQLKTIVMAGTLGTRKKLLAMLDEGQADVCITSYDTLKRDIALYQGKSFNNCVLDEAQYIKNPKAAVSKAVKVIRSDHRFALTGTPIENRLSELWSIFDFLMPGFLYSLTDFSGRFEVPIVKQQDELVTAKLKSMTAPFVLRRLKVDVLKDLPDKLEEVRYARIEGEQQKLYDAQVVRMKEVIGSVSGRPNGEDRIRIFAELTRIRQICCDPSLIWEDYHGESAKRQAAMELIKSAMDGGHRMLLFSQFTSMLELLEEDLKKEGIPYFVITGATPKEKRMALVHAFNEGDIPLFLISLKAGGNGLNLTGADVVIHYDPWWNLAVQNQATDRAHRIGQTRQVTVYRLILKDTIEEKILQLQEAKKDLADAILEGSRESIMSLSGEELLALLE